MQATQADVGVGHSGVVPAEVVGGRAWLRTGAARPDTDLPEGVGGGDGAAAGADLQHLDHRDRDRHAAALLEPGLPRHLEAGGGARHVVLDEGDLGRRAAHVEGADAVAAVAGGQIGGEHGATGRPRLHQPHGERRGNLHAQQSAAGVDEMQRAGCTEPAQLGLEAPQVGGHQRLHVGVGAGGVEPLVLAHPGRDLAAERRGDAGRGLQEQVTEPALVVAVAVAVHEPDGHGLVSAVDQLRHDCAGAGLVEGHQRFAPRVEALADDVAVLALDERRRQHDVEVVLLEAALGTGLDHVAEPCGGHQGGARAGALDQGVGGQRGAVDDLGHLGEVDVVARRKLGHRRQHALLGTAGRQHLRRDEAAVFPFQHHVGEGAPHIGADTQRHS